MINSSFYKYILVEDPEKLQKEHLEYCNKLGIKGKILVGKEGINGSISGTRKQIGKYEMDLIKNKIFKDIQFKRTKTKEHPFRKMIVRERKEIVNSGLKVNLKNKGKYINSEKLKAILDKG